MSLEVYESCGIPQIRTGIVYEEDRDSKSGKQQTVNPSLF